jgi:glycosyltransferase involved in cell wall biosynthesis
MTEHKKARLTISYIANVRIPSEKANSIQILKMCDAFRSSGFGVELAVPFRIQGPDTDSLGDIHGTYSLSNTFPTRTVYSPDFVPLGMMLPVISRPLFFLQSVIFACLAVLRSLVIRKKLWYYTRDLWVALLLAVFFPARTVFEIHTIPASAARRFALRAIIRQRIPIVSMTSSMKRMLVDHFRAEDESVFVSPDGFDDRLFNDRLSKSRARNRTGLSEKTFVVGYFGRFSTMGRGKGVEELISAVGTMRREECLLLLVGDDFSISRSRDVDAVVVPHIPQSELLPYIRSCDVLVMPFPRTPHYEKCMSPLKLFEYMASGVPVISTDLPSIREIVNDDDVHFIKDNSPENMAGAIRLVKDTPEHAKTLAESALRKSAKYTWSRRAEGILEFLSRKRGA